MQITFSPIRSDNVLTLERTGDTLVINDIQVDLSGVVEGSPMQPEGDAAWWFAEPVKRINGELHVTLLLPHGANAPQETLFPTPVTITADGPVPVPEHELPPPEPLVDPAVDSAAAPAANPAVDPAANPVADPAADPGATPGGQ